MARLGNPLLEDLGIELVAWREGHCELELVLSERHLNRRGRLQGGVTATLLDAACGYAGLLRTGQPEPDEAATITLGVNYLAGLSQGRIRAVGRVTGRGAASFFRRENCSPKTARWPPRRRAPSSARGPTPLRPPEMCHVENRP